MNRLEIRTFAAVPQEPILATAVPTALSTPPTYARWKWLQRMALGRPLTQYVNASGQIQVQLASQNATGYLDVDYAVMDVFTNDGIAGTLWIPPQNYRWQYQLQVSSTGASQYASTEGINVNICVVPLHWRRLCNS